MKEEGWIGGRACLINLSSPIMALVTLTAPISSLYPPPSTSFPSSSSSSSSSSHPPKSVIVPQTHIFRTLRFQRHIVRMAPDEEKMTRRSPLDFPIEWERPKPGRRPDIFPQFSPMKTPLPPPLPADPPEEDEEEEEKKEEEEEDPEKEETDKPEKQ